MLDAKAYGTMNGQWLLAKSIPIEMTILGKNIMREYGT